MRRFISLSAVVILAIMLTNWYDRVLIAEGQPDYWSLNNQMKSEERPYTSPLDVNDTKGPTQRKTMNKLTFPSLREMQRMCDGQCFYAPHDCNNKDYGCPLIASVAMHNEDKEGIMYCDYFGTDSLRESFCYHSKSQKEYRAASGGGDSDIGKADKFYTVTLHRTLGGRKPGDYPSTSCPTRWNWKTGRRCRRTEFVAISFVTRANASGTNAGEDTDKTKLDPEDLWYVCTVDQNHLSRISMWTKVSGNDSDPKAKPQQLMRTKPHLESGMGVVFSRVTWNEDIASMGCQFVIQESNMTLLTRPKNAALFGNFQHRPITVKIASGYVKRADDDNDTIRHPFYKAEGEDFAYYNVYSGREIKPTDQLLFDKMVVGLKNASKKGHEFDIKNENVSTIMINDVLKKCDDPKQFPNLYIACYPPSTKQNCIHTGRCPVMFIVEVPRTDTSFKTFKGYLYGLLPKTKNLRKGRRPMGYASVGFSKDNKMGRDFVITCHADGADKINTFVSINYFTNNIYPGKNISYDDLIWNVENYGTMENEKILCAWEMNSSMVVNMLTYEPIYEHSIPAGENERLEFNFSDERVHLLLAAGNRNYPKGIIMKHDFAQVLDDLFSKELFFEKAGRANIIHISNLVLMLVILMLVLAVEEYLS